MTIFLGSALLVQQPRAAHAASHTDVKAVLREVSNIFANSRGAALTGAERVEVPDGTDEHRTPKPFEKSRTSGRVDPDRIQLDGWRDPLTGQINPLTEIIEVHGNLKQGTGTFLAGCRIITAYHVLLAIRHPLDVDRLDAFKDKSLVGQWFEFETRPLPSTRQKTSGRFVVLGHGKWAAEGPQADAAEDWAIGYDEECLSEKLKLGFVDLVPTEDIGRMAGRPLFTAGHSILPAAMRNGQLLLYVDARCGVSPEFEANRQQDDYLLTNCSVTHGGSGQLLLERAFLKGRSVTGLNGRPQLSAYGIFQASVPDVDMGAPNLENESMGVAPFTKSLRERIEPFLLAAPSLDVKEVLSQVVSFGFEPAANDSVRHEAAFRIVPGLAGRCASLEWTNTPDYFLRHRDGQLTLEHRSAYRRFEREATFCLTKGLADPSGVSFEALSVPNYFIRYRDSALWLDRRDGTDLFEIDATFEFRSPTDREQSHWMAGQVQASELRPGVMLNGTKVVEEPIIEVTNDAVVTGPAPK